MAEGRRVPDAALLALVQAIFGSLSVVGKVALPQVGPLALVGLRIGAAALLLLLLERMLVAYAPKRGDWPLFVGLSLLGVVLNQLLFLVGLSMTTAVEATVLITTIPVFTLAVGLAVGRERWSWKRAAGMAVGFAGVVVLVLGGLEGGLGALFGSGSFLGNLLVVLNSLLYSIFLVASRPVLARVPPLSLTAYTFAVGALLTLPVLLLGWPGIQAGGPDAAGLAALAYIILGPTVTTYFLVSYALVRVPASTVAGFIYLQPLVGGALAVAFLGEPVTTRTLVAAALIFIGVALVALQARGPRRYAAPA